MDFLSLVAKLTLDSTQYESGLGKAKGLASTLGDGIKTGLKVAGTAIASATTALAGFEVASVKTGMNFDKSISQVAATMGLSMDEMKTQMGSVETAYGSFTGNLRDYAQFMGKNTAFSATEAADALNYMALAGYDVQTSMQMLPNVLNLAAAGNMDLARASDMVTDTQTAFGISLERTNQMVDEMAKAASTGNTSVEQLGDAFLTVGGLAQELNGGLVQMADGTTQSVDGVQELEIALTAMANAGIKGSEAGTHMRNMLLKLSSPTDDGTKALEAMGVTVFDTEGKMRSLSDVFSDLSGELDNMTQEQKIQTISDLFNTRDLASAEALLNAVNQDWDRIGESILNADGAAQKMADTQLDNLAGDITLLQSAFEGFQIAISDSGTPALREFVQLGTRGLSDLTTMFGKFDATPYLDEMGRMTEEGAIAQAEFKKSQQAAIDDLFQAVTDGAGMIGEAVPQVIEGGIKLLGAFGKGLIDNADIIFESLLEVGALLADNSVVLAENIAQGLEDFDWGAATENMVNFIVDALTGDKAARFMEAGVSIVGSLIEGIVQGAPKVMDGAIELISKFTEGLSQDTTRLIESAVKLITDFTGYLSEHLGDIINVGIDVLLALIEGITNGIPALLESIPIIIENLLNAFTTSLPKLAEAGTKIIVNLALGIVNAIPTLIASLPQIIMAIVNIITTYNWLNLGMLIIKGIASGITSLAKELPNKLKDIAENAKTTFMDTDWTRAGIDSITKIVKGIIQLKNEIVDKVKEIADNVVKLWENRDWLGLGKYLVEGIWSGISGSFDWITQRISEWAGSVFDWFKKVFKIASPSKLMRDGVGIWIGRGVADGIEKSLPYVESAISDMTDLVEEPDISANLDVTKNNTLNSGSDSQFKESQKINALAEAIVDAFVKADIGVDIDGREFGRLVRKAVTV